MPDAELSLIPFPGADVLVREIDTFDLIIFENFTYRKFGIFPPHLESIKNWVNNGGGFIMIGGDNSFGKGHYQFTAIKDILPVIMDDEGESIENEVFKPQIVDTAFPIFQSTQDNARNVWKDLPELDGYQKLLLHPQGTALIRHPWARRKNENIVILATRQYGKGRTAALATNSTWRWKMLAKETDTHSVFWNNLINYLTGALDEELSLIHI